MDHIAQIRAFNRDYTVRLGLLDSSYLGSGLTLTQLRVLQEVSFSGEAGVSAREISQRIGADEGYLSRILNGFEKRGWMARATDPEDARRKLLRLTDVGKEAYAPLNAASAAMIAEMTGHLPQDGRDQLCRALKDVQRLLEEPLPDVQIRGLQSGDLGWITEAHGRLYAQEEGYDLRFEALVARILADYIDKPHPNNEAFIAVDAHGQRLGCTFVVHEDDETMRLRLVILEPEARGLGLGKKLLNLALGHAKAKDYKKMVLWTQESLTAACALYAKAGFEVVSSKPNEGFGAKFIDQVWEKTFN